MAPGGSFCGARRRYDGRKMEPRTQKLAAGAAQYETARKAFLNQLAQESERKFAWLETAAPDPPVPMTKGALSFVAAESKAVQRSMSTYAGDPDPGIQELRAKLQRENAALAALNNAMADREKTATAASRAAAVVEQNRTRALAEYRTLAGGWRGSAAQADRESAAWVEYYKLLATGAQDVGTRDKEPAPTTSSAAASSPAPAAVAPVPVEAAPATTLPAVPLRPSITPVPLIRYTGAWTFPAINGLYHGPEPEFADLEVNEDQGHASGTLFARFRPGEGLSGDRVIRFTFAGEFSDQRTQVFPLVTSDGAKGTVELIPGPAFNLIEINFQITSTGSKTGDAEPGRVRQGNMVLVKK